MKPGEHPIEGLSSLLDGELSVGEAAAVEEHLAGCASCRALQADLRRIALGVRGESIPAVPAGLAGRIGDRLRAEGGGPADAPSIRRWPGRWTAVSGIAATLVLGSLAVREAYRVAPPRGPVRPAERAIANVEKEDGGDLQSSSDRRNEVGGSPAAKTARTDLARENAPGLGSGVAATRETRGREVDARPVLALSGAAEEMSNAGLPSETKKARGFTDAASSSSGGAKANAFASASPPSEAPRPSAAPPPIVPPPAAPFSGQPPPAAPSDVTSSPAASRQKAASLQKADAEAAALDAVSGAERRKMEPAVAAPERSRAALSPCASFVQLTDRLVVLPSNDPASEVTRLRSWAVEHSGRLLAAGADGEGLWRLEAPAGQWRSLADLVGAPVRPPEAGYPDGACVFVEVRLVAPAPPPQ